MYEPYISVQDNGYRTENEELIISNGKDLKFRITSKDSFGFSFLPYSTEELTQELRGEKNAIDLLPSNRIHLCIDRFMLGLGGIDSWLSEPLDKYKNHESKLTLEIMIEDISGQ